MSAFYLTLLAVLLSGIGSREMLTVAALTRAQGQRFGVLATGLLLAIVTSAIAAYAASVMLVMLPVPARPMLAAIALGFAGLESVLVTPRAGPREPTHSLGALGLVLAFQQMTEAARFTLFGLAVGMAAPLAAGLGGGLAGLLLPALAWTFPHVIVGPAARIARRLVGVVLFVVALAMFLMVRGIV